MFLFTKTPEYNIEGKVVLLTGGLGAIGRELTKQLVSLGAKVAVTDIISGDNMPNTEATKYLAVDLREEKYIAKTFEWATEELGHIDILINNAGVATPVGAFDPEENFGRVSAILDVNLKVPIETTRQFVKYLQGSQRTGVVINMASMGGLMPNKGGEIYGAAKAGLIHFTRACQHLSPQIRVTAVAPYYVNSPMVHNNPKLKNNNTVYPQLMLELDQVSNTVIKCIRDTGNAGQTFAMIGKSTYIQAWQFDLNAILIKLHALWSMVF